MDDVNNMDDSMDTVEQPLGAADRAFRTGVDRRAMLKAAVAAGTIAGTWVAPRIETLGFAPAYALTPCVLTSTQDTNRNEGCGEFAEDTNDMTPPHSPCGHSYGNCNSADPFTFTFPDPANDCTSIVVTLMDLNCAFTPNPDAGSMALIITSRSGDGCAACTIHSAEFFTPGGGMGGGGTVVANENNGTIPPADMGGCGFGGIDVSTIPCLPDSQTRLRVRLDCSTGIPGCDP